MTSLVARYRAVVCDLDGVVYRGPRVVEHAAKALAALDTPIAYATNNASRTPAEIAGHLTTLEVSCRPEQVVTSSQAAAWLLVRDTEVTARVLAVGGPGVAVALEESGFRPVLAGASPGTETVRAVVQGYGPGVTAADLAEAAYAIENGARWVATNTDATLPTDRGVAPGNGTLVAAVARAVGADPDLVAGKPFSPLYELAVERLGVPARQALAVGDRLDTDIEGAVAAGMDSLLVLTGVDDLEAVLRAPARRRPTFVAPDLRWLHRDPQVPDDDGPALAELAEAIAAVHRAQDRNLPAAQQDTARDHAESLLTALT